jgi:hypothetical protein
MLELIKLILIKKKIITEFKINKIKIKKITTEFCSDDFNIFFIILIFFGCTSKESNPQPADP